MLASVSTSYAVVLVAVSGYLLGSIPAAQLLAGRRHDVDLRDVGDRNPGYWNTKETLGRRAALPVFVADVAKGAVAAAIGVAAAAEGEWWLGYVGGGAAMVGHAWPLFARFRGGRSVLTWVGTTLVVAPLPAAVAIGVLAVVWGATRRFDIAARTGVIVVPLAQLAIEGPVHTAATGALMTLIGIRFAAAALADRRAPR